MIRPVSAPRICEDFSHRRHHRYVSYSFECRWFVFVAIVIPVLDGLLASEVDYGRGSAGQRREDWPRPRRVIEVRRGLVWGTTPLPKPAIYASLALSDRNPTTSEA